MDIIDKINFLIEAIISTNLTKIGDYKGVSIRIDVRNFEIATTGHGKIRFNRDDNVGDQPTKDEILNDVKKALPRILADVANGEVEKNAEIVIINKKTKLNIVIALGIKKGPDTIRIMTVIRKPNFKVKANTEKVYKV